MKIILALQIVDGCVPIVDDPSIIALFTMENNATHIAMCDVMYTVCVSPCSQMSS